jgi:hypothetical protein
MRANISIADLSTDTIVEDWTWLLKKPHTVIAMNNFGGMFLPDEKGAILLPNIARGVVERIATSDEEFQRLAADKECQKQWFLTDFLTEIEGLH